MSILITADLQLCDNPRDAYRHAFQKKLRDIVKANKVELTLILGDLTEEKDRHGAWLVNQIVDHLNKLRRLCNVVIVQGNHDYVDVGSPFYKFVDHIKDISWISVPTEAGQYGGGNLPTLHELGFTGLGKCLLLPHTTNYKKDWAGIKLKSYDWIFTHNTFAGADSGMGIKLRGIPTTVFGNGQRVISGDIHVPQVLNTEGASWIEYVGSPYLCDFGDRYAPRVLLIKRDNKLVTLPVCGSQKRLVEIASLAELKPGSVPVRYVNKGDILKVKMLITNEQRAEWPALKDKIREWGEANDYLIHLVQPVLLDKVRGVAKRPKHKQQSDDAVLRTYAKRLQLDKLTVKAGLNLMRRV